jgi:predicted porin
MTGFGANYNLSKTTRFYVRTDNINYASNLTASSGTAQKRTAIGFSSSF